MSDAVDVTFVSSHARLGGEENYLARLLEELGPDWIAGVVSLEDAPFVERLRAMNVQTEVIPTSARAPGMLRSALRLRRSCAARSRKSCTRTASKQPSSARSRPWARASRSSG